MNSWDHRKSWYNYALKRGICYCWNIQNYKYCAKEDESCPNGKHICLYCDYKKRPPQGHQSKSSECPCQSMNYNPFLGDGESRKRSFDEEFCENFKETARHMSDENICTASSCSCPSAQKECAGSQAATCSQTDDVRQPVRRLYNSNSETHKHNSETHKHSQPPAQGPRRTTIAPTRPHTTRNDSCSSRCDHRRSDLQSGESLNHHHHGGISSPSPTETMHCGGDLGGGARGFQENPRRAGNNRSHGNTQQAADMNESPGHEETHGGVAGAGHDPGTAPARSHPIQNSYCHSCDCDHNCRGEVQSGSVSSSRPTDTEYSKSWRPRYDQLHETFRKESLENPKSPVNHQKHATAGTAQVNDRVLFLEKEVETLRSKLTKERADKEKEIAMLRSELTKERADNLELKCQLGEARTMKPYSRLSLINNIPTGFNAWAKQRNQNNNPAPGLGSIRVPPLFNRESQDLSRDHGQDIVHLYGNSKDNPKEIYPEWFLRKNKGKDEEGLKEAWDWKNIQLGTPRDLVKEINEERRNGIRPKPLFP